MREILEFIFAVAILIVAFKLTMGFLKIALWLAGILILVCAVLTLFG